MEMIGADRRYISQYIHGTELRHLPGACGTATAQAGSGTCRPVRQDRPQTGVAVVALHPPCRAGYGGYSAHSDRTGQSARNGPISGLGIRHSKGWQSSIAGRRVAARAMCQRIARCKHSLPPPDRVSIRNKRYSFSPAPRRLPQLPPVLPQRGKKSTAFVKRCVVWPGIAAHSCRSRSTAVFTQLIAPICV